MTSRFTLLAPWWAIWLANAAAMTATLTVLAFVTLPKMLTAAAWPFNVVALVLAGLVLGVFAPIAQQPMRHAYANSLTGLSPTQRRQAVTALRRNDIPSDPAVLTAAVRVGALHMAYLDRLSQPQKTAKRWLPAICILNGATQFWSHHPRMGFLWLGLTLYYLAYNPFVARRWQQLGPRVERLRAAATDVPQAQTALTETAGGVTRPRRRMWAIWAMIAAMAVCFAVAYYLWGSPFWRHSTAAPHGRCDTVDATVTYVSWYPEILRPDTISNDSVQLSQYQDWAAQLHTHAEAERDPELFKRLANVDELAAHAVAVVTDLRTHGGPHPPADVVDAHETDYRTTIATLQDQLSAAKVQCHTQH